MAKVNFITLWNNHPGGKSYPCSTKEFRNQCAIRMGIAFLKSGIKIPHKYMNKDNNTKTILRCNTCFPNNETLKSHKGLSHTIRAQELADWVKTQPNLFGPIEIKKKVNFKDYLYRQGLLFFKDGWVGGIDHIDLWNGNYLKAGTSDYFEKAKEVWFWDLP